MSGRQPGQGRGLGVGAGVGACSAETSTPSLGTLAEADGTRFPRGRAAVRSLSAFSRSQLSRRSLLKWWSLVQ